MGPRLPAGRRVLVVRRLLAPRRAPVAVAPRRAARSWPPGTRGG